MPRYILANKYASEFGFYLNGPYRMEAGYDNLYYGPADAFPNWVTGNGSNVWLGFSSLPSLQSKPGLLRFATDSSNTRTGFTVSQARVCCTATADTNRVAFQLFQRYTGFLLGNGDVVEGVLAAGTDHLTIAMWSPALSADFDLYVRCNQPPSSTAYTYRSYTGQQEFLHLDPSACPGGTWYVAIPSYSGSGPFDLVVSAHKPSEHRDLKAGVTFDANVGVQGGLATIQTTLRDAARRFYGATEGAAYIGNIQLWNNTGSCANCGGATCDICFTAAPAGGPTTGQGDCTSARIWIYPDYYASTQGLVHEFSHALFCLNAAADGSQEEYETSSGTPRWRCGHSVMADPWSYNKNLCYDGDHRTDADPLAIPLPPSHQSNWLQALNQGKTSFFPSRTGDNYDFTTFSDWSVGSVILR